MATTKKTTTKKTTTSDRIKVVITTKHRGVFFGEINRADVEKDVIEVHNKRNCLRWVGVRGFIGLASEGPGSGCRVGPAAPIAWVRDVTDILLCTPDAAVRWEAAPWS